MFPWGYKFGVVFCPWSRIGSIICVRLYDFESLTQTDSVGTSRRSEADNFGGGPGTFVDFSLILCLWFEIQGMRTYNFFDWVSNIANQYSMGWGMMFLSAEIEYPWYLENMFGELSRYCETPSRAYKVMSTQIVSNNFSGLSYQSTVCCMLFSIILDLSYI